MISVACHIQPITISLSGVRLLYGAFKRPGPFCETSTEVTNYVNAFCETMWKTGATEIEFWHLPLGVPVYAKTRVCDRSVDLMLKVLPEVLIHPHCCVSEALHADIKDWRKILSDARMNLT